MAKEKKEKSSKGKFIILIIVGLIVLGAGSYGAMYTVMKSKGTVQQPKVVVQSYYDLGEFTVNLADKDAKRYLKASISVGYDSETKDGEKELEAEKVVLRDAAIFYLKAQNANQFNSGNEVKMKKELVENLNKALKKPMILDVYINDIIIQ